MVKSSKTVVVLAALIIVLAACTSAVGLFWRTGGSRFDFPTVHGVTATINGSGLYRFDTPIGALSFRGTGVFLIVTGRF
jgi:hypothetical protein